MLVLFASRFLQWLHLPSPSSKASNSPLSISTSTSTTSSWRSTPRSSLSSDDDSILPLSASSTQDSFNIPYPPPKQHLHDPHLFDWKQGFTSNHASILLVITLFPLSTGFIFYCLSTLPITMSWPHTLADLAQLGSELHGYSQSGRWPLAHVMGVMAISAIWKHAWSIPGSVLWNVLAGALFSPAIATIMLTALTTIGSACATLLSTPLAPFLTYLFPRALEMTKNALGGNLDGSEELEELAAPIPAILHPSSTTVTPIPVVSTDETTSSYSISAIASRNKNTAPWVRLSVLRLIGVVPWSGINIACGVCGVSLGDCMLGTFIGCLPWTAVTCQIGDILQTVASTPSPTPQTVSSLLATPAIIFKLIFLSFLSLAPILGRERLRAMITPDVNSSRSRSEDEREKSGKKWNIKWVGEWRRKLKLKLKSESEREKEERNAQLEFLVDEKRRLEELPS